MGILSVLRLGFRAIKFVRTTHTSLTIGNEPQGLVGEVEKALTEKLKGASDFLVEKAREAMSRALDKVDEALVVENVINRKENGNGDDESERCE